jgi:EpsD family peptidyl-prolyl cis-trans isomerase
MFHYLNHHFFPIRRLGCALLCLPLLAACGKTGSEKLPATQVAVKVNGDEISVHQINQALARAGRLTPDQAAAAGKQILEQLIDQQLLVQKSLEKKLDRDPDVLNALEASRRQILSQAYLEKAVPVDSAKPAPEDVKKFYDAHPELFAQRRIYRLQELTVALTAEQMPALRSEVDKTKNLNDITVWLRGNNIRYNANAAVRAAEQLPQEMLPHLAQMKDGDIGVSQTAGGVTVLQLVASQSVPLAEAEAKPFIEKFLINQKRTELASDEMKQLRQSAKLEYMGDFVKTAAGTPAASVPATPAAASPAATSPVPVADVSAPAAVPPVDETKSDQKPAASVIDKGVSGLR